MTVRVTARCALFLLAAVMLSACPSRLPPPRVTFEEQLDLICEYWGQPLDPDDKDVKAARGAAEEAVTLLEALAAAGHPLADETLLAPELAPGELVLGEPRAVAVLSVQDLERFYRNQEDQGAEAADWGGLSDVLTGKDEMIFRIDVKGSDRGRDAPAMSTVTVKRFGNEWRIATVGQTHQIAGFLLQFLGRVGREDLAAAAGAEFVVSIPALYQLYLARCVGEPGTYELQMDPIYDTEGQGLFGETPPSFAEVLEGLRPRVEDYKSPLGPEETD